MATGNVAVVTGSVGPGRTATAQRIGDVQTIKFDFVKGNIAIENGIVRSEFAYTGVTGVVFAISGGNTTVTIT